jgi:hypothetical protein
MKEQRHKSRVDSVRWRAAEIRRHWTAAERRRRTGLPPDTPWLLLRDFFMPREPAAAPVGLGPKTAFHKCEPPHRPPRS